jgi:hypothetical protein
MLKGADTHYASGAPGIGFYETDRSVGSYGFSSFTASGVPSQSGELLIEPFNTLTRKKPTVCSPYDGFWESLTHWYDDGHLKIHSRQSAVPCDISTYSGNLRSKAAIQREASCVV